MQKKVFSLMMTLILAFMGVARAEVVEIGDGGATTNSYLPSYSYYNYSLTQQLYTAAEMGGAGTISSVAFYNGGSEKTRTYDVYMVNTTKTAFASSTDWITVTAADKVFSGSVTMVADAWTTITLDTPFAYDGTSNFALIMDDNTNSWSSGMACRVFDATAMALRIYSDPTNYDPMDPTAYSGTVMNVKNQIQIDNSGATGGGTADGTVHVLYAGVMDTINLGPRPGYINATVSPNYQGPAWMEPVTVKMFNEANRSFTVSVLDFTPNDSLFFYSVEELPFALAARAADTTDVNIWLEVNQANEAVNGTTLERQFVAIYEDTRLAAVWPITAEVYSPECPDIWELALNVGVNQMQNFINQPLYEATITGGLHNDYNLPFPEIPEGYDAVYKLTIEHDSKLDAYVLDTYANGKVALYTEDFYGEGGPMATNNYTGIQVGGGASAGSAPFEALIGDPASTSTTGYNPMYYLYNYSLSTALYTAAELAEAGVTSAPMSSLSWFSNSTYGYNIQNVSIWMANVTDTEVAAMSPLGSTMTLVYQGNHQEVVGENEFVFNQGSFAWDGTSNVLVMVQMNNGSWSSSIQWQSTNPGFAAMSYAYTDNAPYDAQTSSYSMYTSSSSRANILFKSNGGRTDRSIFAGPVIEGLPLTPGNYYLVASSTDEDFEVYINVEDMPCPEVEGFAFNPSPADNEDEVEPASVTLRWMVPNYATGWRLIFGSTYHPEVGHPQTIIYPEDGSFTNEMANSFTVRNLWNNTNYFWRVEFNNDNCPNGVSGPIWGFTTHLNVPQNLVADDETIFEENDLTLSWDAVVDRTYRNYFIYQDGVKIGQTATNQINATTYTIPGGTLPYNMAGYVFYVTAVYDEGESAPSNTVTVKVSGRGTVNGYVYEQDGIVPIPGATVTFTGTDEFGMPQTFTYTTNGNGYYEGEMFAGSYNGQAGKDGYQTAYAPTCGNPVGITYNTTTPDVNFILDENFDPVCQVIAEYYPDSLDPHSPYVKVYWGCGLPGNDIIEDFETGDFSMFDWQVSATYPWSITTANPYEGAYCMVSGGAGVANVVSDMSVTVNIPHDGLMSFFGKISCENNWDYGYFYIDGTQMGSYTGAGNWTEREFPITAGDHTFKWSYTKDGSVNSNDDCFYVDYINFYKQPAPAIPGMTYDFDNSTMQGWTSIDADGDGHNWMIGSSVMSGVAGHNGSADFVFSQSYDNTVGVLYPDNYLVSPQVQLGGVIRFYACAQDASYAAEHFGVAVSTTSNTSASAFTTIQEWTMSAKDAVSVKKVDPTMDSKLSGHSRGGNNRAQGAWYEYTVDLSAYSGMGYVAIRHFNCSDMFYLDVDDITIGEPGKGVVDNSRSLNHYRVYRTNCYNDGPYTEENTVLLATVWVPDTVYIDVEWADLAPGVYKWGVGAVYAGNRGELYEAPITWAAPQAVNRVSGSFASMNGTAAGNHTGNAGVSNRDGWLVYDDGVNIDAIGLTGGGSFYWGVMFPAGSYTGNQLTKVSMYDATAHTGNILIYQGGDTAPGTLVGTEAYTCTGSEDFTEWTLSTPVAIDPSENLWIVMNNTTGQYVAAYAAYCGDDNSQWISIDGTSWDGLYNATGGSLDGSWMIRAYLEDGGTPGPTPGTGNSNYLALPRESETIWSNCLDKDMYMYNEVSVNVLLNSADSPEGIEVSFRNYNDAEQELYPQASIVLDETGYYLFDEFRRGDYEVTVEFEGYETIIDSVNIWAPTELRYVMTEILFPIGSLYVSSTGWAMWDGQGEVPVGPVGPVGPGDTFSFDCDGGMPAGWTTIDADGDGYTWVSSMTPGNYHNAGVDLTGTGHNSSAHYVISGSWANGTGTVLYPDNYLVSPQVNIAAGSTFSFWACAQDASYPADHFGVAISDNGTDWTMVNEWTMTAKGMGAMSYGRDGENRVQGNWYNYTVDLSNYAGQKYIAIRHFNCSDQFILNVDDIELTAGRADGRHLESYKVMCTSIDGEPIFNANTEHNFCQVATDFLVPYDHYICKVQAIYSTGSSAWTECEWQYIPCENYNGTVGGPEVNGNTITWEYPGSGPVGPIGEGDSFSVDFEGGMPAGWNVVDGNNDGYTWCLTSNIPSTWTYYAGMTLDWYHNGSNAICSGSYINGVGALTPDEYIVTPQVNLTAGSTFSFWAAATDASYAADHFGVFVSDNGTSDWTMVNEWTMTAKSQGKAGNAASRDGRGLRLGTWYNYSVDLSNFAGQKYIAIRHFNCNDQYILCVDDIQLTAGAKGNRAPWDLMMTFTAPEAAQYGVVYDGNNFYTSNWGYSSATHNFYKYDQNGTMIEGFEIPGCGTLRGMTYDGEFVYGVANSSTVYCVDFANHTVANTFTSSYGAMRGITYDPVRDGFWVIGNWSGNLTLIDRTGAIVQVGPEPQSASDLAYYKDENDVEHVFCFNNGTNDVVDYNITTNTLGGSVFNFSSVPGFNGGTSGGCHVGSFNGKIAFIGDIQQDPNLIGIYELRDDNTTPVPVNPTGDVLGAMIFADGEWVEFVPYPTNEYTYEGEAENVWVRIVYNGTANLPEGNIYYSMSCPEVIEWNNEPTCAPGEPIHGEYVWNEGGSFGSLIWWGEQIVPVEDWLFYDDGTNLDAIGLNGGGSFYWGIKIPAAMLADYAGCSVTKIAYYVNEVTNGTVRIYNGSNGNAPGSLIGTYDYSATTTDDWVEWNIPAVAFNASQDLWIVMNNATGVYVASMCDYTGDPNGTMLSLDGSEWYTLSDATGGQYNGTWNLRCFVTNTAKGGEPVVLDVPGYSSNANATLVKAGLNKHDSNTFEPTRSNLVSYNIYRSTDNVNYDLIGNVPAVEGQTYYEYFDEIAAGEYYYQVTAVYENPDCESDPAMAYDNPSQNYVVVEVTSVGENVNKVALYPNPTNGNVKIEAKDMTHITVVSVLGQVIYDAEVSGDEIELNMGQYNAGVYMVRIATENGVSTQRVTVVK